MLVPSLFRAKVSKKRSLSQSVRLGIDLLEDRSLPSGTPLHLVVHPGQSIQAAVDAASPGATIVVEPGTYNESITVSKPHIHLVGQETRRGGGVVLQNSDD